MSDPKAIDRLDSLVAQYNARNSAILGSNYPPIRINQALAKSEERLKADLLKWRDDEVVEELEQLKKELGVSVSAYEDWEETIDDRINNWRRNHE